jgi:hypothetical protein
MARNAGEALGVRAETNFVHDHVTQPESERWRTSVQFANIAEMETSLHRLHAPVWPANVLGPIDKARAEHGRALFEDHCAACHGIKVVSQATPIEWKVTPIPLKEIGTDPGEAIAFKENRYSGKALGIDREIDGAEALRTVTEKVKDYFYDQENYTKAQREDADGLGRKNEVVANLVYKARPLIGIWASPPYLHNGSVPTIYDLLSPERPAAFYKGTREYDPEKLGFRTEPFPNAEEFDSKAKGNSNHGHWFANDSRPGKLGDEFSIEERYALIEYLKSASYADYPCNDAVSGAPLSGAVCGAE